MGAKVTAEQAGRIVNRAERIVRGRIKRGELPAVKVGNSWKIDVDDLEHIPGWRVDREQLARIESSQARTPGGILARLEEVERDLRSVKARLRLLEARNPSPDALYGDSERSSGVDGESLRPALRRPLDSAYSVSYTPSSSPSVAGAFPDLSAAADWLAPHGVKANTARGWDDLKRLRDVRGLTPSAVLQVAIQENSNPRSSGRWRLHRCGDPSCPCVELLTVE